MAPGRARVCALRGCGTAPANGDPEPPVPRCRNNSAPMCEAPCKHLLACGLFEPACSQAAGVSSRSGNSIPQLCLGCSARMFSLWARSAFGKLGCGARPPPTVSGATLTERCWQGLQGDAGSTRRKVLAVPRG